MDLGGGDRRRIGIPQGRNRLKGAQNNILRLKGFKSCQLKLVLAHLCEAKAAKGQNIPKATV